MIQEAASEQRKSGGLGDVLGHAEALQRDVAAMASSSRSHRRTGHVGLDQAGSDGVDPHPRRQLGGERAG